MGGADLWTRRRTLGLLPALGLAGCGGALPGPEPLRMWAMSWEGDYSPLLMPAFTARTGLPVEVQSLPTTASHEKLLIASAGGALPDVFMLFNGWVTEFATIGAIAPVPSPAIVTDMFPGILEAIRLGSLDYAVPWSVAPQVNFYRRDLLAAVGYDAPPGDWAALRTMGLTLKRRRPDDYVFLMLLNWPTALINILSQAGAVPLRDHDTRGNFQTPEAREAFAHYASFFADKLAPVALSTEVQDPVAAFAQGYFAIWPSGPTTLRDLAQRGVPQPLWSTARCAGPHGPGRLSGQSASLCVSATTTRPAEAWALVRHLTSVESELHFQRAIGNLPARVAAWSSPQLDQPVLTAFAEQMRYPAFDPKVIEWEQIQLQIQFAAERVVRGIETIPEALAGLDTRVDRLLAKRRSLVEAGRLA
jgi:multiple sugar transport system substrate-binding protein